jgi:hypothetical protein
MTDILRGAANDRLKLEDERINMKNERLGIADRSHLADAGEIDKKYDDDLAAALDEEMQRTKNPIHNPDDPMFKERLAAAVSARDSAKMDLSGRDELEREKNQIEIDRRTRQFRIAPATEFNLFGRTLDHDFIRTSKQMSGPKDVASQAAEKQAAAIDKAMAFLQTWDIAMKKIESYINRVTGNSLGGDDLFEIGH